MIVGTSSIPYRNKFNTNFLEQIKMATGDGFSAYELNTYLQDKRLLEKNAETLRDENVMISVHANYVENNISSLNPYMRKSSIGQIENDIIFAAEIKSPVVTLHPGEYQPGYEGDYYVELNRSLRRLIPFALKHRTMLALENMDGTGTKLFSKYHDIKRVLDLHPELKITLDLAHLGMANQDISLFLDGLVDRIAHFHISGYSGIKPHIEVSLVESRIDFRPYLEKIIDWKKIIIIENMTRSLTLQSRGVIEGVFGPTFQRNKLP